jgi:hypothetical protein
MPRYEKAPVECTQIVERMMEKYHGPLKDAGVTIDILFAKNKADDGDIDAEACALKLHGYQVAAMVKINGYKLRVQGHADAEIIIDGERWYTWSDEEKDALLDHELEHLELKAKEGVVLRDDLDRPRLRMRKHDHQFGWFDACARRHGKHSFETQQFEQFCESHRQLWIDFDASAEADDEFQPTVTIQRPKTTKGSGQRRAAAGK